MNRRNFLRSIAALAAVAVAPKEVMALARTNVIRGQTFNLTEPLVLDFRGFPDFLIEGCHFVWKGGYTPEEPMVKILTDLGQTPRIFDSLFDGGGFIAFSRLPSGEEVYQIRVG
jgi:hypothetical protein